MHRTLAHIRASMALGVLFVSYGVVPQVQAADPTPQRVAMACTHAAEGPGCQPARLPAARHAAPQRASTELAAVKVHARRAQDVRSVAAIGDGSRFVYDSCGCSNE
jgi:hypothetical protein